jgi:glutathione S-transferase
MNPNGRVPVWQEDSGLVLWESHAILRHLAREAGRLIPGPRGDQWMDWGVSTFYPAMIGVFWQVVRTAPADRSEEKISRNLNALEAALEILATCLDSAEWLDGAAFSVADIALGAGLYRYFDMDIPRDPSPAIKRYYARLTERTAYRETVMTSYEELRAT